MASFEERLSHKTNKRIKKKINVDLTPMVDLGFLLITFFIFTSVISQPSVAQLVLPKDNAVDSTPVTATASLTLRLLSNDSIVYYEGLKHLLPQFCNYQSLRSVIRQKQESVERSFGNKNETVLIIRPTISCTYKNFMDVMDEVYINDVTHYYVLNVKPD